VRESQAFGGELVQVWRADDWVREATQIAVAEVVTEQKDDVWAGSSLAESRYRRVRQKQK
jgi:hypothetical protein